MQNQSDGKSPAKDSFIVIPAIDLLGGKCVRLQQGDYSRETVYSDDPVSQALEWQSRGANFLHIVDLDGAKKGFPVNIDVIKQIVSALEIPCEVGGGVRTFETAMSLVAIGVQRIIFGTAAIRNPSIVMRFLDKEPDRTILGVDAKNGRIATSGWQDIESESALEISAKFADAGLKRFIYTDISTDGMLSGPNCAEIAAFCERLPNVKLIASGGVSSPEDVDKLRMLGKKNLEGVIVGKALYSGKVSMRDGQLF